MKIAIIGGGISGLTCAIALKTLGFEVQVYERAKQLEAVGAGIWLQPNALKVLDHLGLGEKLRAQGMMLNRIEITNHRLQAFKASSISFAQDDANKILSIHRATLQSTLANELGNDLLFLGEEFRAFDNSGDKKKIYFAEKEILADVIIGADGINSALRKQLFPDAVIRYARQTCWRGIASIKGNPILENIGREAWGKNIRFGFSQINPKQVYWFAVIRNKDFHASGMKDTKSFLLEKFQTFHPIVSEILEATPTADIIKAELGDLKRLNRWHHEHICLIGDAAHATTPNMGQGAGQGIEDAYYLSHFLAKEQEPIAAFNAFEKARRKKVDYVVNNSWRFGQMAHHPAGRLIMKKLIQWSPPSMLAKQMQELYHIDTF